MFETICNYAMFTSIANFAHEEKMNSNQSTGQGKNFKLSKRVVDSSLFLLFYYEIFSGMFLSDKKNHLMTNSLETVEVIQMTSLII